MPLLSNDPREVVDKRLCRAQSSDNLSIISDPVVELGRQSLGRPLTASEISLASALEAIFASGTHDFSQVAAHLQRTGVARPSGAADPWTLDALHEELRLINDSLDLAYAGRVIQPRSAGDDG